MPRARKERPISVKPFQIANGTWCAELPMKDADGVQMLDSRGRRRVHKRRGKTKEIVERKIRLLEDQLAAAAAVRAARLEQRPDTGSYTLHAWMKYWLDEICAPRLAYNSMLDYRWAVDTLILPNIADMELRDLEPSHIEAMLKKIRRDRTSADAPHRAYSRLRIALNRAVKRSKETGLWSNPVHAVDEPKVVQVEIEPLTLDEVKAVMAAAVGRRNSARWTVALALGLRQGEALALRWEHVDLDAGVLWVRESVYRRKWHHGCEDPHACGAKYHKALCPGSGPKHDRYHRDGCPKVKHPCVAGCTLHAAHCEHRHGGLVDGRKTEGGQVRKAPKSRAGRRGMGLPGPLVAELKAHKAAQDAEREAALDRWVETGTVFATRVGTVINERNDGTEWQTILDLAGVDHARLHDARHSAATMLLLLKVQPRVVMDIMGWSDVKMLDRYQHVLDEMRRDAATGMGNLLWPETDTDPGTTTNPTTTDPE